MIKELLLSLPILFCAFGISSSLDHNTAAQDYDIVNKALMPFKAPIERLPSSSDFGYVDRNDFSSTNVYTRTYYPFNNNFAVNYRYSIPNAYSPYQITDYESMVGYINNGETFYTSSYSIPFFADFVESDNGFGINDTIPIFRYGNEYLYGYCLYQVDFSTQPSYEDYINFWVAYSPSTATGYYFICGNDTNNYVSTYMRGFNYFITCDMSINNAYYEEFYYSTSTYKYNWNSYVNFGRGTFGYIDTESLTTDYPNSYDDFIIKFRIDLMNISTNVTGSEDYEEGFNDGYANGYNDGLNDNLTNGNPLVSLFFTIGDIPIRMLYSMFNFDVFGISMFLTLFGLVTLTIVIFIVRKLILGN